MYIPEHSIVTIKESNTVIAEISFKELIGQKKTISFAFNGKRRRIEAQAHFRTGEKPNYLLDINVFDGEGDLKNGVCNEQSALTLFAERGECLANVITSENAKTAPVTLSMDTENLPVDVTEGITYWLNAPGASKVVYNPRGQTTLIGYGDEYNEVMIEVKGVVSLRRRLNDLIQKSSTYKIPYNGKIIQFTLSAIHGENKDAGIGVHVDVRTVN